MEKITILIAEDHTLIRETWNFILNSDPRFNVLATCGNGEDAVELARQHTPERDARRTAYLESQGFTVLRFWNNDVLQNLDGVWTTIEAALTTPPHPAR